jgi:hypothetical protein
VFFSPMVKRSTLRTCNVSFSVTMRPERRMENLSVRFLTFGAVTPNRLSNPENDQISLRLRERTSEVFLSIMSPYMGDNVSSLFT